MKIKYDRFYYNPLPEELMIGVRTPMGGFLNHSDEPNCRLFIDLDWDDYLVYKVMTIKKVKKGQELFLEYGS